MRTNGLSMERSSELVAKSIVDLVKTFKRSSYDENVNIIVRADNAVLNEKASAVNVNDKEFFFDRE